MIYKEISKTDEIAALTKGSKVYIRNGPNKAEDNEKCQKPPINLEEVNFKPTTQIQVYKEG